MDDVTEKHEHAFGECHQEFLTTPQLRKLVFYTGRLSWCVCGFVRLDDMNPAICYSRNASRVAA